MNFNKMLNKVVAAILAGGYIATFGEAKISPRVTVKWYKEVLKCLEEDCRND